MAPFSEEACMAKGLIAYMDQIAEHAASRHHGKIAKSPEFKKFLFKLSERAPLVMHRLMKSVSRKCDGHLRDGIESRTSRKRADPPVCHKRNAKRYKTTCAAGEEVGQNFGQDDDEEDLMKNEMPGPQPSLQCSGGVFSNSLASDNEGETSETSERENRVLKPAHNMDANAPTHFVCEPQEGEIVLLPTNYGIERGLAEGSPLTVAYIKARLLKLKPLTTRANFSIHDEIAKVWKIIPLLNFFKTRHELHQHLENREKIPGHEKQACTNWINMSEPSEIIDALENIKMSETDNKIHRACGQTMLVVTVDAQVAQGYRSTVSGHRLDHMALLEELACQKAGPVSKKEVAQMISSCFYEYHMGQKWLAVMDWFGGSGTVLVFLIAGIGPWFVNQWTEFQRTCVQHIAGLLDSIRGLVKALGSEALERYCRNGCLGNECLERVKLAKFIKPDANEGDEEDEEDEEEAGVEEEEGVQENQGNQGENTDEEDEED